MIKRPDKLTPDEVDQVESMLRISERLRQAYVLKNEFYKVMDSQNSYEAKQRRPDGTCYSMDTIFQSLMTASKLLQTGRKKF